MFGFGVPELIVVICMFTPLILWVVALVDIIKSEFMGNNKVIWLLVVLLLPLLGAILYFLIGKKQKVAAGFADNHTGTGKKFCSACGEELNVRAELCPNCGVRQQAPQKAGSNPVLIVLIVVVVGLGSVAVLGILAAIAIPQFSSYRMKAYNSAAISDLKNAKTNLEAYAADHGNSYPRSLDQAMTTFSAGVTVQYEKTGKNSYTMTSMHKDGDRIFLTTSESAQITWKNKRDENGPYLPI